MLSGASATICPPSSPVPALQLARVAHGPEYGTTSTRDIDDIASPIAATVTCLSPVCEARKNVGTYGRLTASSKVPRRPPSRHDGNPFGGGPDD